MNNIRFVTTTDPDIKSLQALLQQNRAEPHIHAIDMPYRLTATWQDRGCEIGLWVEAGELVAWAVFQPPWYNVDYVLHPSMQGTPLEREIFAWGKAQMQAYADRTGDDFYGSFEFAAGTPHAEQTATHLTALGFQPFDWSVFQFALDLRQDLPAPALPDGFQVRPLRGSAEAQAYVDLHRAAFDSDAMTLDWRQRTLTHAYYRPELDLVVVDAEDKPAGFCICWVWQDTAHIEPLGVHPDFQGRGLGKALERSAAQFAQAHELKTLLVDHGSFNERAISLSQQTGFRQSKNALRYYVDVNLS